MKSNVWLAVPAVFLLVLFSEQASSEWGEERTWADVAGRLSVTAELEEVRGDIVLLRCQDGRQIQCPLDKLCAEDSQFLTQQTAENLIAERHSPPV